MLKRKFYNTLLQWKKHKQRECLLVNGARQVGKTFIIDKFGKEEYKNYIYLNFIRSPELKSIFDGALEPAEIYKRMSLLIPKLRFAPGETLIFLDEIQACGKARTALKFLAMDERYDFIASGSLLGIHYRAEEGQNGQDAPEEISIPVGYEREVEMHSLDFEEFLWASGITEEALGILKTQFEKRERMDNGIHEKYMRLLREYLFVGGMPEVVKCFLESSNFQEVHAAQEKIMRAYEDDIGKYAKNTDKPKIKRIYQSIPRQLAKEYTKFQYKTVDKNGSARKYGNAIDWLLDAGMIQAVCNVSLPLLPLRSYEILEEFKIYATDIGLCSYMFGFETQAALMKGSLKGPAKGGIYENLVFDMLHKRGYTLHYYRREDRAQEIEFLIEQQGEAIPVEVKSKRGESISLNSFIEHFSPSIAYKLADRNIGTADSKITLPLYMAAFL